MSRSGWLRWLPTHPKAVCWCKRVDILTIDLTAEPLQAADRLQALDFQFGNSDTLRELVATGNLGICEGELPYYSQFLSGENRLAVSRIDGAIAAYAALLTAHKRMGRGEFVLQPGEFFIMACFTHPQFRGRGLCPLLIRQLSSYARKQGYSKGYLEILHGHRASVRYATKAGFAPSGSYYLELTLMTKHCIVPRGSLRDRFVGVNRFVGSVAPAADAASLVLHDE